MKKKEMAFTKLLGPGKNSRDRVRKSRDRAHKAGAGSENSARLR